jgi:hypothetical protein
MQRTRVASETGDAGTKTSSPDLSLSSLCCEDFVALIAHGQTVTCKRPRPVSNTLTKEKGIYSCLVTEWVRPVRDTLMTRR